METDRSVYVQFLLQINRAASLGAIGALIFPDPHSSRHSPNDTYPNSAWMSGDAIFERPMATNFGDPLTPQMPSIEGMYRRPINVTKLASIPSQPISYNDALVLLKQLRGIWKIKTIIKNFSIFKRAFGS